MTCIFRKVFGAFIFVSGPPHKTMIFISPFFGQSNREENARIEMPCTALNRYGKIFIV